MAIRTMAILTMALLTVAILTMAILTMAHHAEPRLRPQHLGHQKAHPVETLQARCLHLSGGDN